MSGFEEFWAAYPRKVGKLDAVKAYARALKHDTAENILLGVQNYKRHLPDEVQFICHPATFLNKGRWLDSYEVEKPQPERYQWTCPHEVTCGNRSWCDLLVQKEAEGWHRDPVTGAWSQREQAS